MRSTSRTKDSKPTFMQARLSQQGKPDTQVKPSRPNIPRPKHSLQDKQPLHNCPFCQDKLDNENGKHEYTVNQIIQVYKWFETNPSGLLLINARNSHQQRFLEDTYS